MNMMQIAESIERVKAIRQSTTIIPQNLSTEKKKDLDHVPFILRRAYQRLV